MQDLYDNPRLLRNWDPQKENSFAAACLVLLQYSEAGDDALDVEVPTTLGELRNHVQWCQIAGNVIETARGAQDYFIKLEMKLRQAQLHIQRLEHMLMSAGVDPPEKPKYAKTNP